MKNFLVAISSVAILALSACNDHKASNQYSDTKKSQETGNLKIDSVSINDSLKLSNSLKTIYTSKLLVFPSLKDKKLLDSIYFNNKGINDFSKTGLQSYLENRKNAYLAKIKQEIKGSAVTDGNKYYYASGMHVKSNKSDFMHIQYDWSYYEGGAHDSYGFSDRIFDLKNNRKLELKDITIIPTDDLQALLMKNVNKISSGSTDNKGNINNSEMLLVKEIPVTNNFYFDDKNLYFHYSPYEIAASAVGDITIPVSWQELKNTLKPSFEGRLKSF